MQARARGGAFRPGWLLTGERGPELRYASRGGFIAHHGQLQRLAGLAARVQSHWGGPLRSGLSAASIAGLAGMAAMPLSGGAAGASMRDIHIGDITINAPNVTDPSAVADMVLDQLGDRVGAEMTASFSDRG